MVQITKVKAQEPCAFFVRKDYKIEKGFSTHE